MAANARPCATTTVHTRVVQLTGAISRRSTKSTSAAAVLVGVVSVQGGAALARSLFDSVDPAVIVFARQGITAIVLCVVARPSLRLRSRAQLVTIALFGGTMSAMSLSFYAAVARLPLALAVTLEMTGPLALAVVLSRRLRDVMWSLLAVAGVLLLRAGSFDHAALVGAVFALVAAAGWACYLLLSRRLGKHFEGYDGLALGMAAATVCTAPIALRADMTPLVHASTFGRAAAVAALAALIPFSLELRALRHLDPRTVATLLTASPLIAAIIAWLTLAQRLTFLQMVGMTMVLVAAGVVLHHDSNPA